MTELLLIGIGTGNPDHLTREGEKAIREADVILIPRKGEDKADLADLRLDICAEVLNGREACIVEFDLPVRDADGDYLTGVDDWHDAIADAWLSALQGYKGDKVALLVWGDPSLYDSTLRIAARLSDALKVRVVPGITSLQVLTAAHGIPLNEIGAPVVITTGRQLRNQGWPKGADTVAVMLDGKQSFQAIDPAGTHIWWGAFLGMENEILVSGPLAEISERIVEVRAEARKAHGWIMDIYLMRRT